MAELGTFTYPMTVSVHLGPHNAEVGSGDVHIPITAAPDSPDLQAGYRLQVTEGAVSAAVAAGLRRLADELEAND